MSTTESAPGDGTALREYLRIILSRKWLVIALVVIAAAAAYALSKAERAAYRATAQMILVRQDALAGVSGQQSPNDAASADRLVKTMSDLARVPAVAARTVAAAQMPKLTPGQLLDDSSVTPSADADVLSFSVTNHDAGIATRLASTYARQFGEYRHGLDVASIDDARARVEGELRKLSPARGSALYAYLVDKSQQLQSLEAFQSPNSYVVHPAGAAAQIRPSPLRNAVLAGVLGLLLGVALAFLVDTLDTRVRSVDEIRDRLGLRVLARIPPFQRRQQPLVMLVDPSSPQAEAFRALRINLDVMNFERHAKKIMIAGAHHDEGKSMTVANLAVALARAGRSVAVVDCDLHHPTQHRLFGIEPTVGLTDVLVGDVPVESALVSVTVGERPAAFASSSTNGSGSAGGIVQVLPGGGRSAYEDKLVAGERIGRVLRTLESRAEYILVDTPPLLQFGDGVGVSAHVDGVILVVRLKQSTRATLPELRQVLAALPAEPLGVVATAADGGPRSYYGGGAYGRRGREAPVRGTKAPDPSAR